MTTMPSASAHEAVEAPQQQFVVVDEGERTARRNGVV